MNMTSCIGGSLPPSTVLQICGDYAVALGGLCWLAKRDHRSYERRSFTRALFWFMPIEYIQPCLGWVQYRRCATQRWLPYDTTWMVHSVWDGLIVVLLYRVMGMVLGSTAVHRADPRAPYVLGAFGMLQEICLECTQTLWEYVPCPANPQWATLNGRPMTLQQWHWAFIPGLIYLSTVPGMKKLRSLRGGRNPTS